MARKPTEPLHKEVALKIAATLDNKFNEKALGKKEDKRLLGTATHLKFLEGIGYRITHPDRQKPEKELPAMAPLLEIHHEMTDGFYATEFTVSEAHLAEITPGVMPYNLLIKKPDRTAINAAIEAYEKVKKTDPERFTQFVKVLSEHQEQVLTSKGYLVSEINYPEYKLEIHKQELEDIHDVHQAYHEALYASYDNAFRPVRGEIKSNLHELCNEERGQLGLNSKDISFELERLGPEVTSSGQQLPPRWLVRVKQRLPTRH